MGNILEVHYHLILWVFFWKYCSAAYIVRTVHTFYCGWLPSQDYGYWQGSFHSKWHSHICDYQLSDHHTITDTRSPESSCSYGSQLWLVFHYSSFACAQLKCLLHQTDCCFWRWCHCSGCGSSLSGIHCQYVGCCWTSVKKKVNKKSTECQQKSEKMAFSQWKSQKKSQVNQSKLLVALVNVDLVKKNHKMVL